MKHVDPMIERLRFIRDARQHVATFADLRRLYGITRATGSEILRTDNGVPFATGALGREAGRFHERLRRVEAARGNLARKHVKV